MSCKYSGCSGLNSVVIGSSVTSIGSSSFYNCSSLKSIDIPNSVVSIGERAFYNCSGLTYINIGSSVEQIGAGAFSECKKIESVVFHCKTIGRWFGQYSSIEQITIEMRSKPLNLLLSINGQI